MTTKYYVTGIFSAIFIILALVFGLMIQTEQRFIVQGTLVSVDRCTHDCWAIMPAGCAYQPYVTLNWNYNNETWLVHNVSAVGSGCGLCCYSSINQTVFIEISPPTPSLEIQFWFQPPSPISQTYIVLTSLCGMIAFLSLSVICAMACVDKNKSVSPNVGDRLIPRGH